VEGKAVHILTVRRYKRRLDLSEVEGAG